MNESLYPVPQGPPSVLGPSRLLRVTAAEITAGGTGILRGREQPVQEVPPPRLLLILDLSPQGLKKKDVLRGAVQEVGEGPRSRLVVITQAEITSKGVLRGREQPSLVVDRPRLTAAAIADLICGEILRGRGGLQLGTFPDARQPRPSLLFGSPLVTIVPPPSAIFLRARGAGLLDVGAPLRRSFLYGLPQVAAIGTGQGLLFSDQRNRLVRD